MLQDLVARQHLARQGGDREHQDLERQPDGQVEEGCQPRLGRAPVGADVGVGAGLVGQVKQDAAASACAARLGLVGVRGAEQERDVGGEGPRLIDVSGHRHHRPLAGSGADRADDQGRGAPGDAADVLQRSGRRGDEPGGESRVVVSERWSHLERREGVDVDALTRGYRGCGHGRRPCNRSRAPSSARADGAAAHASASAGGAAARP
ncbi:MAG: hypothetical protein WKG00_21265 [Polyangiaceae bacterium]